MAVDGLWSRALKCGASTLYEASGGSGALDPAIRPVWHGAALCGSAFPVACGKGDNLAVHRALEQCKPGDVLVITAGGDDSGYCGEVLATAAKARGVTGVVVDGGVRDIDAFERMGFPVFARWISMRRTVKKDPGEIGRTIRAGGVEIRPGTSMVGDADGVFATEPDRFEATVAAGEARLTREAELITRIENGELTLDLMGLRPKT
jgi:4-hydroxy-4-methyl-2-oxoglutarate aldolase